MTAEAPLTAAEYRDLLSTALEEAPYADTRAPSAHTLFMPDSHRTALYVDTTVVPGGRGVGKTFWYRSLLDEGLRDLAAAEYRISRLRRVIVSPGHGLAMRSESYPSPQVLRALVASGDTYDIWYAVLLNALGEPELRALPNWSEKVAWVRATLSRPAHDRARGPGGVRQEPGPPAALRCPGAPAQRP